jgi:hypothetical protein
MLYRATPLLLLTALLACDPGASIVDDRGALDLHDLSTAEQAVVQGRLATADETYATVALTDASGTFCTGTLIAPQVVVTAAHCVVMPDGSLADAADVVVVSDALVADSAPASRQHQAAALIPHEEYSAFAFSDDPDGLANDRDIALVLLASPVNDVMPADVMPLDQVDQVLQQGTECIITGFGITSEQTPETGTLYIAEAPYIRRSESEFIVGHNGTPDSCYGDSGGPIYVDTAAGFFLVGATSRGVTSGDTCGTGGIYGLVPAFDDWIEEHSCGLYVGSGQGASIPAPDPGSQGTCEGNCGGFDANTYCYCQADCVDYADCCPDYAPVCGGDAPAPPEPINMDAVCAGMDLPVDSGDGDGDAGDGDGDLGDGDGDLGDGDGDVDGDDGDADLGDGDGDIGDGDHGDDADDMDEDTDGDDDDDDGSSADGDDIDVDGDGDVGDGDGDSECHEGGTQFTPEPERDSGSVDGCSAVGGDQRTLCMLLPLLGLLRRRRAH